MSSEIVTRLFLKHLSSINTQTISLIFVYSIPGIVLNIAEILIKNKKIVVQLSYKFMKY
jgi:hypothetical protein